MHRLLFVLVISGLPLKTSWACNRIPQGTIAAKSPVDENYGIAIVGSPQTYVPGQKYNVTLTASNGQTFISFMLGVESEGVDATTSEGAEALGTFEIIDLAETRFSPRCANLVENTNTNVKTRVEVVWVAPSSAGMGCVNLKATVVQHRDVWFMDDGLLTKRLCEEEIDDIDSQPSMVDPCCACDEAKYELTFEGKWSRHTHPKDFPANSWRTRFSDIIGASHTIDYRFWQYGELASEGLREVAEHGSTRTLESELKDQSDQIRTIIKARGIAYPNVTGKTFAVFRVDSRHHLISLVSMIDPSPDWIVGISGLELCLPNCSWIESKVHNLYPWDAGTDGGPSYMSADQPQVPPDVVRRIKPNYPNDPRSPFYDPNGTPMKPLATLYINRRRLYEKTCNNMDNENDPSECATHPWSRWDECSAKCGPGKQYRTREFKDPSLARKFKCRNSLREEQDCVGRKCASFNEEELNGAIEAEAGYPGLGPQNPECAISNWTEWSTCSVTCGAGVMMRSRHYLNPRAKKKCQKVSRVKLQETKPCEGLECGGDIDGVEGGTTNGEENGGAQSQVDGTRSLFGNIEDRPFRNFESYSHQSEDYIPPECGVSHWSDFSPCLGTCGGIGTRQRERHIWNNDEVYGVQKPDRDPELDPCRHIKRKEVVNCTLPSCDAIVPPLCYEDLKASPCRDSDVANYWFYDHMSDQCAIFWADKCDSNRNKFSSKESCEETCQHPRHKSELQDEGLKMSPIDCLVSDWIDHACNASCGEGIQIKTRRVLRSPKYGGKGCPKHMVRLEKCYQRCDGIYSVGGIGYDSPSTDRRRTFVKSNNYDSNDLHGGHHYQHHLHHNHNHNHNHHQQSPLQSVASQILQRGLSDCRYSEWSAWTPCTASCGDNSYRQRTRTLVNNSDLSYKCKDRVRIEKCKMLPCLLDGNENDGDGGKW